MRWQENIEVAISRLPHAPQDVSLPAPLLEVFDRLEASSIADPRARRMVQVLARWVLDTLLEQLAFALNGPIKEFRGMGVRRDLSDVNAALWLYRKLQRLALRCELEGSDEFAEALTYSAGLLYMGYLYRDGTPERAALEPIGADMCDALAYFAVVFKVYHDHCSASWQVVQSMADELMNIVEPWEEFGEELTMEGMAAFQERLFAFLRERAFTIRDGMGIELPCTLKALTSENLADGTACVNIDLDGRVVRLRIFVPSPNVQPIRLRSGMTIRLRYRFTQRVFEVRRRIIEPEPPVRTQSIKITLD